jgi:hypothetical protein
MYVYNKVRVHLYFDVHHKMRSYGVEVFGIQFHTLLYVSVTDVYHYL